MTARSDKARMADAAPRAFGAIYRDVHLGRFSSHPRWLADGSRWLRRAALVPVALLYVAAVYLWLRGRAPQELLPELAAWIRSGGGLWSAGLVAFFLGMSAAAAFQLRVAAHKVKGDDIRAEDQLAWSPSMVAACLVAGLAIPLALTFAPGLPIEVRFFGALLAFAPAATLSYLLPAAGEKAPFPWFMLLAILPALAAVVISAEVSGWIARQAPQWVTYHLPVLEQSTGWRRLAAALAAAVGAASAFRLAAWMRTLDRGGRMRGRARPDRPETESRWRRFLRAIGLGFLLKNGVKDDDADSEDDGPPPWLRTVAERASSAVEDDGWLAPEAGETSPLARDDRHDIFFDGSRPTTDQHKALEDFLSLRRESVRPASDGSVRGGFDLVVEGPPGSGRTTLLDAMALLSFLSGGARSLLLVSDDGKVEFALRRIRGKIDRLGMEEFLTVGSPSDAVRALMVGGAPPEIVVATPDEWEEATAGSPVRGGSEFHAIRRAMLLYGTLLIDDWDEHPPETRVHLPFIIDKHRLLLESEMRPRSAVYAFPRLSETGRELALARLAGDAGAVDPSRQLQRLRYRPLAPARVFGVRSTDSAPGTGAAALGEMVDRLLDGFAGEGVSTILMRRGIDLEEARRQTEAYRVRHGEALVSVCYCGDQVAHETGAVDAFLLKASEGAEAVLSFRSQREDGDTLFLRLTAGEHPPPSPSLTPLLAHRSGRSLAETHLRSVLRFLSARSPVPQRAWGQLGIRPPDATVTSSNPAFSTAARLMLDLPERLPAGTVATRPYLRDFAGFVALDEDSDRLEICDLWSVPSPGPAPILDPGGAFAPEMLLLAEPEPDPGERNCHATWRGSEGSKLGRSQLHHLEELVLRRHGAFAPGAQRRSDDGSLEFEALPFKGDGTDLIHPKFELSWTPLAADAGASAEALRATGRIEIGHGGPAHRYLWLGPGNGSGKTLVSASLVERCDDADRPSPLGETAFSYHAEARLILLLPSDAVVNEPHALLGAAGGLFAESLGTGRDEAADPDGATGCGSFLPALSYAFARALARELPGAGLFAKTLCFELRGPARRFAPAAVWFLEPLGTGRSLTHSFERLLRAEGCLECFARHIEEALSQCWDGAPPTELASFWLPRRLRRPVSDLERKVASGLAPSREAPLFGQDPNDSAEALAASGPPDAPEATAFPRIGPSDG